MRTRCCQSTTVRHRVHLASTKCRPPFIPPACASPPPLAQNHPPLSLSLSPLASSASSASTVLCGRHVSFSLVSSGSRSLLSPLSTLLSPLSSLLSPPRVVVRRKERTDEKVGASALPCSHIWCDTHILTRAQLYFSCGWRGSSVHASVVRAHHPSKYILLPRSRRYALPATISAAPAAYVVCLVC